MKEQGFRRLNRSVDIVDDMDEQSHPRPPTQLGYQREVCLPLGKVLWVVVGLRDQGGERLSMDSLRGDSKRCGMSERLSAAMTPREDSEPL